MDLHVSIQGDSLDVSQKKKVMLRALEPGIFIQTDKAVYKPGQQGEGRDGVCLDEGPGDSRFSLAPTQCELMEMGGSTPGCSGTSSTGPEQCQDMLAALAGDSAPLQGSGWASIHLPHADVPTTHSCVPLCSFQ